MVATKFILYPPKSAVLTAEHAIESHNLCHVAKIFSEMCNLHVCHT